MEEGLEASRTKLIQSKYEGGIQTLVHVIKPNPHPTSEKVCGQVQGKYHETQNIWNSNFTCRKHAQGLNTGQSCHKIFNIVQLCNGCLSHHPWAILIPKDKEFGRGLEIAGREFLYIFPCMFFLTIYV